MDTWLAANEGRDLGEDVEARLRAKDKLYAKEFDRMKFVGVEGEVEDEEDASEPEEGADGGAEKDA